MSSSGRTLTCQNCHRVYAEDELDGRRWCASCRGEVIRRATWLARVAGVLCALLVAAGMVYYIGIYPRFLAAWLALVAAVYFLVFYLVRRVGFEIIRGRGVPPGKD